MAPYLCGRAVLQAHLTDLRTALDQAYTAAVKTHAPHTDSRITAGTTTIKASHLSELRTGLQVLE